jgi:hypothetical protein
MTFEHKIDVEARKTRIAYMEKCALKMLILKFAKKRRKRRKKAKALCYSLNRSYSIVYNLIQSAIL